MSSRARADLFASARRRASVLVGVLLLCCTATRIPRVECREPSDCGEGRTCSAAYRCTEAPLVPSPSTSMPPSSVALDAAVDGADAAPAARAAQMSAAQMPVTPLVVDDFEDGDSLPRDERFAVWQHYSWSPAGQNVYSWVEAPGDDSNASMHLRWELQDVADGVTMYTGGGLRTIASNAIVDLSRYSRVVLSHRFEASGSCKPVLAFQVALGCPELETAYVLRVPVSPSWITVSLPFADFAIPDYITDRGLSMAACLAVADGISFGIGSDLVDGECSTGVLSLDSISFR